MTARLMGVFLVALLSSWHALAKSPPPGTGAADVKVNVLLMLDTSASTGGDFQGVAADASGNFVLAKYHEHKGERYNAQGVSLSEIGLGEGSANGYMTYPSDIALDASGNSYVADYYNARVQKFAPDGTWLANFNCNTSSSDDDDHDQRCAKSVALDANGNVYASGNDSTLFKWGPLGGAPSVLQVKGDRISIYGGYLYSLSRRKTEVYKYDLSGNIIAQQAYQYAGVDNFYDIEANVNGVFVLGLDDNTIFVYDHALPPQNQGSQVFYQYSSRSIDPVLSLGSDPAGNLYVAGYAGVGVLNASGRLISSTPIEIRLDELKRVIKLLVSNSDLTRGANFGLMSWATEASLKVKVSNSGAEDIYTSVDELVPLGEANPGVAMEAAKTYLDSNQSPIDTSITCQKTVLIILSDGVWDEDQQSRATTTASTLAERGVETFVIGFQSIGDQNYFDLAVAGGTYPDSPLYADDWQSLYRVMASFIQKAISTQLSFAAPTILPSVSGGASQILQSSFFYKPDHQWEGRLKMYALQTDGSIGNLVWDAGERLAAQSPDQRQIWTVSEWLGGSTSLNNFNTANVASLKQGMYESSRRPGSDADAEGLIQFIRGFDSFDEDQDGQTSDERWKLADLYHSSPIVVGNPNLPTSANPLDAHKASYFRGQNGYASFKSSTTRSKMVYVGGNDGMLHAFDASTGDELWAFIPPMLLDALSGLKSNAANSSTSIYGVDGSPSVADVYINGAWKTVLMAGLGRGGKGYFALDVTQPNSPQFMFAFQNQAANRLVRYWGPSGLVQTYGYSAAPPEHDFSELGEAWSKPQIFLMPSNGVQKHVAVFGGGYNAGVDRKVGNAVFVVDLTDGGKLLKKIDLQDVGGSFVNAVPGDVTLVTGDTTSQATYQGALAYVVDTESKLWKLNLSDAGTLYQATEIFDAEASKFNQRYGFFGPTASISNSGELWLYFGTGNQQSLQAIDPDIDNRVYGIKDRHFPEFLQVATATNTDLVEASDVTHTCPKSSDLGWFNRLLSNEKVTGRITVSNEVLYVPRYLPDGNDICASGSASLTEHDYSCGQVFSGGTHNLGKGIPTQAAIFRNKIYVGVSGAQEESALGTGWTKSGNIVVGESVKGAFGAGQATVESWRELY